MTTPQKKSVLDAIQDRNDADDDLTAARATGNADRIDAARAAFDRADYALDDALED